MALHVTAHEGAKYLKTITSCVNGQSIQADIYDVIEAWGVTCPARQHALKKLLQCGSRDKGDQMADLKGVEAAVARAITLQANRQQREEADRTMAINKLEKITKAAFAHTPPVKLVPTKKGKAHGKRR